MKKFFTKLWMEAAIQNQANILDLVNEDPSQSICDLGCDDGSWTIKLARRAKTKKIYGVDLYPNQLGKAKKRGIKTTVGDLNQKLPLKNGLFDLVHSNQVIEHLIDPDLFLEECGRVLKPGGQLIVSTENLAAWFNIFALIMGWSAFSQHPSSRHHLGNPFSPHHQEKLRPGWHHQKILTTYSLEKMLEVYGFRVTRMIGAGYYPFFGSVGRLLARLNPAHAHFITFLATKK